MIIADALNGRNNNFNLLRFLAAFTVMAGHVSLLRLGLDGPASVAERVLHYSASALAVNAFFIVSGFLVTRSLLSRNNTVDYVLARGLRLVPGLILVAAVSAYFLGPLATSQSPGDYLLNPQTTLFWLATVVTFSDTLSLPGVFTSNMVAETVIGPLWTLKYEVIAYCGLLALGAIGLLTSRRLFALFCAAFFLLHAATSYLGETSSISSLNSQEIWFNLMRFGSCFLLGALCYQFRYSIRLNGAAVFFGLSLAFACRHSFLFEIASTFAIGYALFWFAFAPAGRVREFNQLGDYSYGLYIWHWPIIQTMLALNPDISHQALLLWSCLLSLGAAIASWHLVERPALALHSRPIDWAEKSPGHRHSQSSASRHPRIGR